MLKKLYQRNDDYGSAASSRVSQTSSRYKLVGLN